MKNILFFLMLLTPPALLAGSESQVIRFETSGVALYTKNQDGTMHWNFQVPASTKSERKAGIVGISGDSYLPTIGGDWSRGTTCYVGNEVGKRWIPNIDNFYWTYLFEDGSTITLKREQFMVCEVATSGPYTGYGTDESEWRVTYGTGRYQNASGIARYEGTFHDLWDSNQGFSTQYAGELEIIFD